MFDKCTNNVEWPINLNVLKFGEDYNQVINSWPKTLTVISLGPYFNHDIVEWPPALYELHLSSPHSISSCCSLRKLFLIGNHPNIIFPESIQYLSINPSDAPPHNKYDISTLKFPNKLTILDFTYIFDDIIDGISFPETIHTLSFDGLFNQSLNNVQLPMALNELNLSVCFNQDMSFISKLLNLTILSLGLRFDQPINHVKFHVIDTINDHSNKVTLLSNDFPKSLRLIQRFEVYRNISKPYVHYLRPVGQFTKGAQHY
jgi:hypothetical protein